MSSIFAPNTHAMINGGIFTHAKGDVHYHGFRGPGPGASLSSDIFFVRLMDV